MNRVCILIAALLCLPAGPLRAEAGNLNSVELQAAIRQAVAKVLPATVAVAETGGGRVVGAFSGVIVSPAGHVLTAGHAIEPGQTYQVLLQDGRRFKAQALGREVTVDCGLLKISENGSWPYAKMGCSATLVENQPCVSLGHPGLFDQVRGPVVRFGRIAEPLSPVKGFIRSTCLMEPGDSGGPLFDLSGQVIGIHSMVFQSLDNNYEVPIDQFRRYWDELNQPRTFVADKVARAPQFGMQFPEKRQRGSGASFWASWRKRNRGVRVSKIAESSPAATSGLQPGDRIASIDDRPVNSALEINALLHRCFVLQRNEVELGVDREGKRLRIAMAIPRNVIRTEKDEDNLVNHQAYKTISFSGPVTKFTQAVPQLSDFPAEFRAQEEQLDDSSALISSRINGQLEHSAATIVRPAAALEEEAHDGHVTFLISKSSLVGDQLVVQLPESDLATATVVTRDRDHDLVLIRVDAESQGGIDLGSVQDAARNSLERGQLLLTPQLIGSGAVSVLGSPVFQARKRESAGFLGVMPGAQDQQVVLNEIIPDGAAEMANLQKGDVITHINDVAIRTPEEMIRELQKYLAGDRVELKGNRAAEPLRIQVELGVRPEMQVHAADLFKTGKSKRRDGFPQVFAHDALLTPSDCGGPLFDLNGQFVGINIARFSRSRSYAIPAHVINQFVNRALHP